MDEGKPDLVLWECEDCGFSWEQVVGETGEVCSVCGGGDVHRLVTEVNVERMVGVLGERVVEPSDLVRAFEAFVVGGEGFGEAVLRRVVAEGGIVVREDGLVERGSWGW